MKVAYTISFVKKNLFNKNIHAKIVQRFNNIKDVIHFESRSLALVNLVSKETACCVGGKVKHVTRSTT